MYLRLAGQPNSALDLSGLFVVLARLGYTPLVAQPTRTIAAPLALLVSASVGRANNAMKLQAPLAQADQRAQGHSARQLKACAGGRTELARWP